jgi:hypothetical protein
MIELTYETLIDLCINFVFYFTIGSFGAFLKDLYETLSNKNDKIRLSEILIGGACSTFICMGLQDTWFKSFSINTMVLITFIVGILGFELFGNLSTLAKFKNTVQVAIELKNRIRIEPGKPTVPPVDNVIHLEAHKDTELIEKNEEAPPPKKNTERPG